MGWAIWQNWAFSRGAGRTGSALTLAQKSNHINKWNKYKCESGWITHSYRFSEPDVIPVFSTYKMCGSGCKCSPMHTNHHTARIHNHSSPHFPSPHTFPLSTGAIKIVFELLHHRIEQFSSFQLVFASSAPAASRGCSMKQADSGGQSFSQLLVQTLDLTPLKRLQLGDLLHVSKQKMQWQNIHKPS